jgi:hypothetical protein
MIHPRTKLCLNEDYASSLCKGDLNIKEIFKTFDIPFSKYTLLYPMAFVHRDILICKEGKCEDAKEMRLLYLAVVEKDGEIQHYISTLRNLNNFESGDLLTNQFIIHSRDVEFIDEAESKSSTSVYAETLMDISVDLVEDLKTDMKPIGKLKNEEVVLKMVKQFHDNVAKMKKETELFVASLSTSSHE